MPSAVQRNLSSSRSRDEGGSNSAMLNKGMQVNIGIRHLHTAHVRERAVNAGRPAFTTSRKSVLVGFTMPTSKMANSGSDFYNFTFSADSDWGSLETSNM